MEESASMEIQLAAASINNEDQNTQKEANITGGNEEKNDELVIEIRDIVERLEIQIQSTTRCRIYKVPHLLRKLKEEAYTPQVVSIGPFHHENERLKAMEEHKMRYFRSFLQPSEINLEYLLCIIREMEESIRGCYEETKTIHLTNDRFVKMILVDACFILELFCRHSFIWEEDDMCAQLRSKAIILDLLLLENQLPFFVIEKLYTLASPSLSKDCGLLELSFDYFGEFNDQSISPHPSMKIEHFTDLLRTFQIPPPEKLPGRMNQQNGLLYSATQLRDVGVKFVDCKSISCFGIKFENGVLKIPRLKLNNRTEVIARNIIALEQTRYIGDGYYTDYFIFLDLLIKTRKDVRLLCDKKIFFDYFGDRYAAESMINSLHKGILWISMRSDYVDQCEKLNSFYGDTCHKQKALIKHEYFSTPSKATSTIVTVGVITVLTLIQTVCSIIQVTQPGYKAG